MIKDVMKFIEKANKITNSRYSIYTNQIDEIASKSCCKQESVMNGFLFGYLQGFKAAKAEMKS